MGQLFYKKVISCGQLLLSLLFVSNAQALNLQQAEMLSVQSDPTIERYKASSHSFDADSIVDDTLPDPKL